MPEINQSIALDATPDAAWAIVGNTAKVHAWVPGIADTTQEGDVRIATFADGGKARERIVSHSDDDRTYTYTYIDGPIPLDEYESTLTVLADGEGTRVTWVARLQAAPEVVASIDQMYSASLAQLAELLKGN